MQVVIGNQGGRYLKPQTRLTCSMIGMHVVFHRLNHFIDINLDKTHLLDQIE